MHENPWKSGSEGSVKRVEQNADEKREAVKPHSISVKYDAPGHSGEYMLNVYAKNRMSIRDDLKTEYHGLLERLLQGELGEEWWVSTRSSRVEANYRGPRGEMLPLSFKCGPEQHAEITAALERAGVKMGEVYGSKIDIGELEIMNPMGWLGKG
ncbi:hypothetical protein HZC53_06045 [Candidatus Uhrbacteria bacterium]|nr:hypothetical protein [Candidatus Uhrbacteria bacterium]